MSALDMFPETRVDPAVDVDRRYTTRETMDLCMRLAGVDAWDLDVAADVESHWADRWYCAPGDLIDGRWLAGGCIGVDGLAQRWSAPSPRDRPPRVWCNPPFSDIEPWVLKAWLASAECDVIAMLLPANRTEQPWFQELVEVARDGRVVPIGHRLRLLSGLAQLETHFLPSRIRFGHPGNRNGDRVGSPPFGCMLLVWRST